MPLKTKCPYCSKLYQFSSDLEGTSQQCRKCKNFFSVFALEETDASGGPTKALGGKTAQSAPTASSPVLDKAPDPDAGPHHGASSSSSSPEPFLPRQPLAASSVAESEEEEDGLLKFHPLAVFCLFLGAFALFAASWPILLYFTIPLAILGLLVGLMGYWSNQENLKDKDCVCFAMGGVVNLVVLGVALFWPSWFGINWVRGGTTTLAEDPNQLFVIAVDRQQKVGDDYWADASQETLKKAGVQVKVVGTFSKVQPVKPGTGKPEHLLEVRLRITNHAFDRQIHFAGWNSLALNSDQGPRLSDPEGKSYKMRPPPFAKDGNKTSRGILPPGRSVEEELFFEAPPPKGEGLCLELPATAWGEQGAFKFRIHPEILNRRKP